MAGDWIPWMKGLSKKREVLAIARSTGRDRRLVACLLMEFWEWADSETEDGFLRGMAVRILSAFCPDTDDAFWRAVIEVDWLRERENSLEIPNFSRWMGNSAKRRLSDAKRKRQNRSANRPQNVRKMSASEADKMRTTEQNRTEESNTPLPPKGEIVVPAVLNTPRFLEVWGRWVVYRKEIKKTLKPSTIDAQLKKLAAMGEANGIAAIERAITNGWTGIVFENEKTNGQHDDAASKGARRQAAMDKMRRDREALQAQGIFPDEDQRPGSATDDTLDG